MPHKKPNTPGQVVTGLDYQRLGAEQNQLLLHIPCQPQRHIVARQYATRQDHF